MAECDPMSLPPVTTWPTLGDEVVAIERLWKMGVLEDERLRVAMIAAPRAPHLLPPPPSIGADGLGASALAMPWWRDLASPGALLPSHYETIQILQMLQIEPGVSVLLVGPRANWWTEIMVRAGAQEVLVIEACDTRRRALSIDWREKGLELTAIACGAEVEFAGLDRLSDDGDDSLWDRIVITGALPVIPAPLYALLQVDGVGVCPVIDSGRSMLHVVVRSDDERLAGQLVAAWAVDSMPQGVVDACCGTGASEQDEGVLPQEDGDGAVDGSEGGVFLEGVKGRGEEASRSDVWSGFARDAMRDRFGPDRLLDGIVSVWESVGLESKAGGGDLMTAKEAIADALFRMGNVLMNLGANEVAAEHFGESYRLWHTAEAATWLGSTFTAEDDESEALAWCRRAIETDPTLGDAWNDVGAILLAGGAAEEAIAWFRAAIESSRCVHRAHAWANLSHAHLARDSHTAAFFAAQHAVALDPDLEASEMMMTTLGEDLC